MTAEQKITIQSEISLEQLYRIITQLPFEQRLTLADEVKREALREQWQTLSLKLPNIPEINEIDVLNEIKIFRTENQVKTL
jgi:hypothetical protein